MAESHLHVHIDDESTKQDGTATKPSADVNEKPTERTADKKGSSGKTYVGLSVLKSTAQRLVTTTIGHVGAITGDSDKQAKVNALMSVGSEIASTAAAYGVNLYAGLAVTLANTIKHTSELFTFSEKAKWGGIATSLTNERAGASRNHSR